MLQTTAFPDHTILNFSSHQPWGCFLIILYAVSNLQRLVSFVNVEFMSWLLPTQLNLKYYMSNYQKANVIGV
jgi:hypothetical protein